MNKEFDRDFEIFLLRQVRREYAMYLGIMIAIGFCSLACALMAVGALVVYGREWIGNSIKLVLLALAFAGGCYANRNIASGSREVAEEMEYELERAESNIAESNIPEDYSEEAQDARDRMCRNLRSIKGLIASYGIIAITLWAATALLAALAGLGTSDFSPVLLCAAIITFAMALALSILAIAYIRDLPAARRYREYIAEKRNE